MKMTTNKYSIAAIITALLLTVAVAFCLILGDTVDNIVSGGNNSVYAAEIAVDEGYVANGDVAEGYDPTANVPEGYSAQSITGSVGWNSYITGKDTSNKYFYLTSDITLSAIDGSTEFKGILDGNGHTLTVDAETILDTSGGSEQTVGAMFRAINGGTVKNLKIVVSKFAVGSNQVGVKAGIIAGETTNNARIENVRIDLNYVAGTANENAANVNYLYDSTSRGSGAPNYLILGGIAGDIAGDTTIDETTVSVNANADNSSISSNSTAGFGISGYRDADNADRYFIMGGFAGRVNSGLLTLTNVNLEGKGKIYNFCASEESEGGFLGIGAKKRNNYGYAGGFVGEVGGTAGGRLSINGLNYKFSGVLDKYHMNSANSTGAIVGSGGSDTAKTTISNAYFSSDSKQGNEYIMGDSQWYTGGIIYDISAPVFVSGGKLVLPVQQSTVWEEGGGALYSVTDRNGSVYKVENYMIVDDAAKEGEVYLSMDMFPNVEFNGNNNQQNYGTLYTLNYYTMGSADVADGFEFDAESNTYSFSKTYEGAANLKDINVYATAGDKKTSFPAFSGEKENSGNAGEYAFTLDKGMYAQAGLEEVTLTNAAGNYLVDKSNGAIYKMNVADGAKINISIAKLAVSIEFDKEGNVTYGDSLDTVKTNNPVSIVSVGGVQTNVTPDAFTGYTLGGYAEKTAAGTQITLSLSDVLMNGQEANYEFTLGNAVTTVKQYQITGALEKDKFTTVEVSGGATAVFVPSTTLPDELTFSYAFATSEDSAEWTDTMPTTSDRYYVKVTFDNANYNLATNVYTFTVTAVVNVFTTDKVVDGVFTVEYLNSAEKLVNALRDAVDYDAEVKEESDRFVFSTSDAEISGALDARAEVYSITATLVSERYEEASVTFNLKVDTQKVSVSGETPDASWSELANGVYDGTDKAFTLNTQDDFAKTYTLTYSATGDGEYTAVGTIKNAGYYKVVAASADANYEITDGAGAYFVEKATPKADFSNTDVKIAYGAAAVTGDTTPILTGVYDAYAFTVSLLTESGEAYAAASVNAGGKITVTTQDFAITENADNYNAAEIVGKEITVDKAAISVEAVNRNVTYGDELTYAATDFYSAVNGLVGTDAVSAEYTTDYVVGTSAGSVTDVVLTFTFTSGNADNYVINNGETVKAQLTVDKRTVNGTMVAPEAAYDGKPYDLAYIDSDGILEGDVVNCTVQYSKDGTLYVANAPVDVGTYYVKITSVDNPNYSMGTISDGVQFNIVKAAAPVITVTAKDGLVFDGTEKALSDVVSVSVGGLFEGDESLAGQVQTVCLAKILDAGEYTVSATLGGLANYEDAAEATATVVVAKAPVTVTLKDNSVIYGDPLSGNEVYFVSAEGLVGGDEFTYNGYTYQTEYVQGQTAAGTAIDVSIDYVIDNADNYIVNGGEALTARLNVVKRVLSGTVSAENKTYDKVAYNGATAVWDNLVGDDKVEVTFEYSVNGKDYTSEAPVNAGTYYVRAAQVVANGNYETSELATARFTIARAAAPVINATAQNVVYSGQIINPVDTVAYTVSGLAAGDEALADRVNVYSAQTIFGAGDYSVGLVLKGLANYEDAAPVSVTVTVARADREIQATARMGYEYVEIAVDERDSVEYSLDNETWNALPADGRIKAEVAGTVGVYLRYKQTDNYNMSGTSLVEAKITYDVLEEYVGRRYLTTEVSFANANEIAVVLGWQDDAVGEKSDTYEAVVGTLQNKYDALIGSAKETVTAALSAGATMSGYQKLAATVISVSVGGLSLAVGAFAAGTLAIRKRKGGYKNEK